MGRTKSRPRSIKYRQRKFLGLYSTPAGQRLEKCNFYKLCISKLARIDDPQAKLCKAVLINNTLKKLEKQPEYLYTEPEGRMKEVDTNVKNTNQESLYSRLYRPKQIHSEINLHSDDQNYSEEGDCVQETLSLCDDIIKDFLGVPEPPPLCDTSDPCESDKENLIESEEKKGSVMGGQLVSPYSYSSFLSEVYSITIRKMKYKVEL